MQAKMTRLEWLKDADGNYLYDEKAIEKFYQKQKRSMERQNEKIRNSPALQKDYSVCDADEFAALQVRLHKHNFRRYVEVEI